MYWIGLEPIYEMTSSGSYSLEIQLKKAGQEKIVRWNSFSIGDESNKYQLSISGFDAGNSGLGDGMSLHNGMFFTTIDRDHDWWRQDNCASPKDGGGGWWFKDCYASQLNRADLGQIDHRIGPIYYYAFYDESTMILRRN